MGVGDRIDSWEAGVTAWLRRAWLLSKVGLSIGAVLAVLFLALQARDIYREWRESLQFGNRTPEQGRALPETPSSAGAPPVERWVAPATPGGSPGRLRTRTLPPDEAEAFERRTQVDVTGDRTVAGVPAAEADQRRVAEGGRQGAAEVAAGPASDPWRAIGTFSAPATGWRGSTLDLAWNERTGETRPVWTVEEAKLLSFPNEFEVEAWAVVGGPGRPDGWGLDAEEWRGSLSWTPLAIERVVGLAVAIDYDAMRPNGDEIRYLAGLKIRCRGFGDCRTF